MKSRTGLALIVLGFLFSCQIEAISEKSLVPNLNGKIENLVIPQEFAFQTTENVNLQVQVMSSNDQPLEGVRVSVYDADPSLESANLIESAFTNPGGYFEVPLTFATHVDELHVIAHTIGFENLVVVGVSSDMQVNFGGSFENRAQTSGKMSSTGTSRIHASGKYYYMGTFTQGTYLGYPSYLENPGDVLSQAFLDDVNASIPESKPVPTSNPQYLTTGNDLDVVVEDLSDVWVTFVTEGAGYRNGFGWIFDGLDPNTIQSVSGLNHDAGLISNAANGTESSQSDATVIAFDNVYNVISSSGNKFVNTIVGESYVNPVTVSNTVVFTSPQDLSLVGLPPYDPFIFADAERSKEIHLANEDPTDLANTALYGNGADASDPSFGLYYKTANGLPWAIHIPESFAYPKEYTAINGAYINFAAWATSGGSSNTNWFTDLPANRNLEKIYQY